MGFFKDLFGSKMPVEQSVSVGKEGEILPEMQREGIIEEGDPVDISRFTSGGLMPIDCVYAYIEKNHEREGYDDAICNIDTVHREIKKRSLKSGLLRLLDQVRLMYKRDLRDIDVQIAIVEEQGLLNSSATLQARKETIVEHMAALDEMGKALDENDNRMLSMVESYERGFVKGMSAKVNFFLKNETI